TASLQGKSVSLDSDLLGSLQKLEIELADGRKIESKEAGNGNNPKAQGKHDNGKHKGWEKQKEKGKGHDKHGEDEGRDD
ncbi:MAG TPA: hypothetical protein VFV52_17520, partial [Bacilli bacterium]|nr:hypothetical protein [Bacilli bacterium]